MTVLSVAVSSSTPDLQPHLAERLPEPVVAPAGLVIVLHSGSASSRTPMTRFRPAYLRMWLFARSLHRSGRKRGLVVWLLRNRYRGWNEPDLDAVADARWALARAAERFPGLPVVLVGHSMGGRAALRTADDPAVTAVAALAPWTPREEPTVQLVGRTVVIAHGDLDRVVGASMSYQYSARARQSAERCCRFVVHGDGHAMLRRATDWSALVNNFVLSRLELEPEHELLTRAWAQGSLDSLDTPLPPAALLRRTSLEG